MYEGGSVLKRKGIYNTYKGGSVLKRKGIYNTYKGGSVLKRKGTKWIIGPEDLEKESGKITIICKSDKEELFRFYVDARSGYPRRGEVVKYNGECWVVHTSGNIDKDLIVNLILDCPFIDGNFKDRDDYPGFTNEKHKPIEEKVICEVCVHVNRPGLEYIGSGGNTIHIQAGTIPEYGPNGFKVEELIAIAVDVIDYYQECHQNGQLSCRENAIAKTKLQEALLWLKERTNQRMYQGVEGKEKPHK